MRQPRCLICGEVLTRRPEEALMCLACQRAYSRYRAMNTEQLEELRDRAEVTLARIMSVIHPSPWFQRALKRLPIENLPRL